MPKKAGTEKWKKKRHQEHLEMRQYRYYIFCEGQQTEPNYFLGFKKLIEENPIYKDMVLIEIEPCQAETFNGVEERANSLNKVNPELQYYTANNHRTDGLSKSIICSQRHI